MEDSVDLRLQISSLSLDTVHFAEPTLLVGTYRDSTGRSLILTVDPQTLQVLDTVYRSTYVANVCRAAYLDGDTDPDFVISLTSVYGDTVSFSGVISLYGPAPRVEDTLLPPRSARDLVVDDRRREIWLGYHHDTTITTPQGGTTWISRELIGFLGAFDFDLTPTRSLGDSLAGHALAVADVNADGVNDVVALWLMGGSGYCIGCLGPAPDPSWTATGLWMLDGATDAYLFKSWIELGNRTDTHERNVIVLHKQLPVLDLTGDGLSEAVLSWRWRHGFEGGPDLDDYYAEVFSLSSGQRLWKQPLPWNGSSAYTVIPYSFDAGVPPVLLFVGVDRSRSSGWVIHALDGSTGNSLFSIEYRYVSGHNVTLGEPLWRQTRVIDASGSWLYRWRISLGSSVQEGSESVLPDRFLLRSNSPNPFNTETRISYTLAYAMPINLSVHDVLGRHVVTLVNDHELAGTHTRVWNGKGQAGTSVPSGVYFLRLSSGDHSVVRKMTLLK